MIVYCPEDCEHSTAVPFPHRVITFSTKIGPDTRRITTMIVCNVCGHWIYRDVPCCGCRAGCHTEARYGKPEGFSVTTEKIAKKPHRAAKTTV
jgi:hypothetical protein